MSDQAGHARESVGEPAPEAVARALTDGLLAVLGDQLIGIVGHGSWVHGDFCPGRSDLDLVVVQRRDPDEAAPAGVTELVADLCRTVL